jgi:hypothetical protein
MMKRFISIVLVLLLLSTSLVAFACPYISDCAVICVNEGRGVIRVGATILGTHNRMTQIGFPVIRLYENTNGSWRLVAQKNAMYNPNPLAGSFVYLFTYQGTIGKTYYAHSSFVARDSTGECVQEANSMIIMAA